MAFFDAETQRRRDAEDFVLGDERYEPIIDLLFSASLRISAALRQNPPLDPKASYGVANGAPTATGLSELTSVPLPSWPDLFAPQHQTARCRIPHVDAPPAAIVVSVNAPCTATGA